MRITCIITSPRIFHNHRACQKLWVYQWQSLQIRPLVFGQVVYGVLWPLVFCYILWPPFSYALAEHPMLGENDYGTLGNKKALGAGVSFGTEGMFSLAVHWAIIFYPCF